jgi:hypothetical protein
MVSRWHPPVRTARRNCGTCARGGRGNGVDHEVPKIAEERFKVKQVQNLNNAGQSFEIVNSR